MPTKARLKTLRAARESDRLAREYALTLVASAINCSDPERVADSTGFWLERWQGKRSPRLGTKREPKSQPIESEMSLGILGSLYSLST